MHAPSAACIYPDQIKACCREKMQPKYIYTQLVNMSVVSTFVKAIPGTRYVTTAASTRKRPRNYKRGARFWYEKMGTGG